MFYLPHKPTRIALTIALFCSSTANASFVRDDIDYQYFRDLAENKGQFHIGATNIPIFNKSGTHIGNMLDGVTMPDLKVASRTSGIITLVSPQFTTTVEHNTGLIPMQFGDDGSNPDAHHFAYRQVSQYTDTTPGRDNDYKIMRSKKMVTEIAPIEMSSAGLDPAPYLNKSRFSHYIRVGSGTQWTRSPNKYIGDPYKFLTGGVPLKIKEGIHSKITSQGNVFENVYGPMVTYGSPGDSGSPLLGFDRQLNRWVLVGHIENYNGNDSIINDNEYVLSRPDLLAKKEQEYTVNVPQVSPNEVIHWRKTPNGHSLQDSQRTTVVQHNTVTSDGKDLHFSGNAGILQLDESLDQGAGGLFFNNNFTVRSKNPQDTWLGGGVLVNANHTVNWQVKNPEGDRLSKLGTGTLVVNGQGKNLGNISIGDGRVVLDQRADKDGQQAFNQIGLTSGRATVILNADNQFNPDNFYFGFRGGRLDLNGRALTFKRIQNTDDGARIVNHHPSATSELTIGGAQASEEDIKWASWGAHPQGSLSLYEYTNPYQKNRKDYFRLVGNPSIYYPTDGKSNAHWEYLGSDKTQVLNKLFADYTQSSGFNGYLGETDSQKTNGKMNVTYRPVQEQLFLLSGGTKLNGNLNVESGKLLFSGRPTPHAYDHLAKQDVVKDNDWINREFYATNFNVRNNATLYVGRNVSRVEGSFNADQNATLSLGLNNQTPTCIRSDYTGKVNCNEQGSVSAAHIPQTQIKGDIYLKGNSQLVLGKAHLNGNISANENTRVKLYQDSQWTMSGSSRVFDLAMEKGAEINLHPWYHTISQQQLQQGIHNFNNLFIDGNLTGSGQFNFLSNAQLGKSDLITIAGSTEGYFKLGLKNTGAEPDNASPLRLIHLTNKNPNTNRATFSLANHFVDLGAYRYVLQKGENEYRLYSPTKAVSLTHDTHNNSQATPDTLNNAISLASAKVQELVRLSQEIGKQETQKRHTEGEIQTKREQAQAERREAANQQQMARYYLYWWHRQHLLNLANQALSRAQAAENDEASLNQRLGQYNQKIELIKNAISTAKQQAIEAEKQVLRARLQPNNTENFTQAVESLCQNNNIEAAMCRTLLENVPTQQGKPKTSAQQEIDRLTAQIRQKEQEKASAQSAETEQNNIAHREKQTAKEQDNLANQWYYWANAKKRAQQKADQARKNARHAEEQAIKFRQEVETKELELQVLRESLVAANRFQQGMPIAPDQLEQLSAAMDISDRLAKDYADAEQALSAARQSLADKRSTLTAEQIQRIEAEITTAQLALNEMGNQLETANTQQAELIYSFFGKPVEFKQAETISQFANSALSDLSAQGQNLIQIRQGLQRQLLALEDKDVSVWTNYQHFDNEHASNLYRRYEQKTNLVQLGAEAKVNETLRFGLALSQAKSNNQFDEGISGKSRLNMVTGYAKWQLPEQWIITAETSYGQAKNKIRQNDQDNHFKRHIAQAGMNVAKTWQVFGVDIRPSAGMHYNHFSGVNYQLDLANIEQKSFDFLSYQLGLKLASTFEFGAAKITPSVESQYIDLSNKEMKLSVNNHELAQKFERRMQHQIGLDVAFNQWSMVAHAGMFKGNESNKQKYAGMSLKYQF